MCTISHGRNLNKMYGEGAKQKDQEKPLRLDGKLDNIYEIEGYRIRRYVDNEGQVAIILVKRIGTKRVYNPERKVTLDVKYLLCMSLSCDNSLQV